MCGKNPQLTIDQVFTVGVPAEETKTIDQVSSSVGEDNASSENEEAVT
jgi:hypothetical protein